MADTSGRLARRVKRLLRERYPDFDFPRYQVQYLRPHQRNGDDRPAWSVAAIRDDGRLYSFYSPVTLTEIAQYGIKEVCRDDNSVMLIAEG